MLRPRSVIQLSKTSSDEKKIFSTYQDEFNHNYKNHGSLINHYGNRAYLQDSKLTTSIDREFRMKPFLSPAYRNLNSDSYMCNKHSDNYSNNYRTSVDNVLQRPMGAAPRQTAIEGLFEIRTAPIAKLDPAAAYKQNVLHGHVSDYFFSKKYLKTATESLRDRIACLTEVADYMRNMSYQVESRAHFGTEKTSELNYLDLFGQGFSHIIARMEKTINVYDKLNMSSLELKKMTENFVYSENLVQRNIWDRDLRPSGERVSYKSTEDAIHQDQKVLSEQKKRAHEFLKAVHRHQADMQSLVEKDYEDLIEEAKVIIMAKLFKKEYEKHYLRDSNGYIKSDGKRPITEDEWLNRCERILQKADKLNELTSIANEETNNFITRTAKTVSDQWIDTHKKAINQIEDGLTTQGKLITKQYELKTESAELNKAIKDTRAKLTTVDYLNQAYLAQVEAPGITKIDPYYDLHKLEKSREANRVWNCKNDLRNNLNNMWTYRGDLNDRIQRLDNEIKSNHVGLNYDLKTIVEPRAHNIAVQPSVDLVSKSMKISNRRLD